VVGREPEVQRTEDWLAAVARGDGPGPLVFVGEVGLGKTTLWEETVDRVDGLGGLALTTRCSESETTLGFAGLADLLTPSFDRWRERLPQHVGDALAAALMLRPRSSLEQPLAVLRGAQLALEVAAEEQPFMVLGVDDVQWLDGESARALAYALRRWTSIPIGVVATWRAGTVEPVGLATLPGRPEMVELGPLDEVSLAVLVNDRSTQTISTTRLSEVVEISAGNPFFAVALALAPAGVDVPPDLAAVAAERVLEAGEAAREAVELVAVRGPLPPPTLVKLGVGPALDAAVRSGVLVEVDGVIRFDHPLLAWAAYRQLPPARRIELHQAAAADAASIEQRATHLAQITSGPDPEVAALMDEASSLASTRNARDAAAVFAQHAARLTDAQDLSPLARRLADVAWALSAVKPEAAAAAADQVLVLGVHGSARGRALQVKNETAPTWQESLHWLEEAIAEPGLDAVLSVNLHAEHAWIRGCLPGTDIDEAYQEAQAAVDDSTGMPPGVRIGVMAVRCWLSSLRGDPEAISRFEECLALDGPDVQPANGFLVRIPYAGHLAAHGQWAEAIAQLDAQEDAAKRHGNDAALGLAYASRARLELTRGDADALDRSLALLHLTSTRDATVRTELSVVAALAQARRGDPASARTAAAGSGVSLEDLAFGPGWVTRTVEAVAHVTAGQAELAADEFGTWVGLVADDRLPRHELVTLFPEAVTSLVSAGRGAQAESLLDALNRPGRPEPLASVVDDFGRGVIALGSGHVDLALALLAEARTGADTIGARWLLAQATHAQGLALHRAGRRTEAAAAFTVAADHFDAMRAGPWAERSRDRARAAVPRPQNQNALTPSETKVVEAAATGLSNAEIAATLFVTIPTVEAHLTRAYRKLGIRSRAGLAARLRDHTPDNPAPAPDTNST
jgi:DNA-binding CsgD family transcriptional regulator